MDQWLGSRENLKSVGFASKHTGGGYCKLSIIMVWKMWQQIEQWILQCGSPNEIARLSYKPHELQYYDKSISL